jgi:hypothetical protein
MTGKKSFSGDIQKDRKLLIRLLSGFFDILIDVSIKVSKGEIISFGLDLKVKKIIN